MPFFRNPYPLRVCLFLTLGLCACAQDGRFALRHQRAGGIPVDCHQWRAARTQNLVASVILSNLVPGAYTAALTSKGGTTGRGLIEIYQLP